MIRLLRKLRLPILLFLALSPVVASAKISSTDQKSLAEAFGLFRKGAYPSAIEKAESIRTSDRETLAATEYFLATVHAKMQSFDKAAEFYEKAAANGSKVESIHYEYGQALFALQKMKEAEQEFRRSIAEKFKVGASAYYIAYIRSLLDDKAGARDFYNKITKLQNDPDRVKQSSLLQIAELALDDANDMKDIPAKKAERKRLLEGEVQALYRRARNYSPNTPVADQARAQIGRAHV
mgnify:FL=1